MNGWARLGLGKWLSRRPARLALSFSIAGLVILIGYQNCDNTRLALVKQASIENIKTNGEICAGTPSTYENYTKVMFVVDKSGSNSTTDTNSYRVNTISNFYQKHQGNAFVQWGLVVFNGNTSEAYINNGSSQQPTFSSDVGTVNAAIAKIGTAADTGATPYKSATAMARSGINYDLTLNPGQASSYVVVFLSDGQPTDYGAPADETAIMSDVDSLVKMGRVTLSTVYYGPADAIASGRLSKMAQA
ncbi:MAG: VWA domain-containing protein [Bdellovibrionales bacterium]|nr:VWA domain-containing protein [Bdellovibrionales bacterium]